MGFDLYYLLNTILAAIMLYDRYKAYKDADKGTKEPETPKEKSRPNKAASAISTTKRTGNT